MADNKATKGLFAEWVPLRGQLDLETDLISQLGRGDGDPQKLVLELAQLCSRTGRQHVAIPHLERVAETLRDPESRAYLRLTCGQLMEQAGDFEAASTHYERGLTEPARSVDTRYFLHNNLGFSLNELARHEEAVLRCRQAIEIEPERHNAVKNLAIAFEHLGNLTGAALSFVQAARQVPTDTRALMHLTSLLEAHPELYAEVEDLRSTHDELLSQNRKFRERLN